MILHGTPTRRVYTDKSSEKEKIQAPAQNEQTDSKHEGLDPDQDCLHKCVLVLAAE
jgi:hypothetical protein